MSVTLAGCTAIGLFCAHVSSQNDRWHFLCEIAYTFALSFSKSNVLYYQSSRFIMHEFKIGQFFVEELLTRIEASLSFQACVLCVNRDTSKLQEFTQFAQQTPGWLVYSIGRDLSSVLVRQASETVANDISGILLDVIRRAGEQKVVLSGIDLLFEPSLQLDPLALIVHLSRVKPIVALWPGSYTNGVLSYAVPEHFHFRTWSNVGIPDNCIFLK